MIHLPEMLDEFRWIRLLTVSVGYKWVTWLECLGEIRDLS